MARELQLDKELVFTVRPDAPLRLTRGQVSCGLPLQCGHAEAAGTVQVQLVQ